MFKTQKRSYIGFYILFSLFFLAFFASPFYSNTPYQISLLNRNLPPSIQFWIGTDELGRDLFARTLLGLKYSITIGLIGASMQVAFGILYGSIGAIYGNSLDRYMVQIANILYSVPYLFIVIGLNSITRGKMVPLILSLFSTGWIPISRIVRGELLALKKEEYISACYAMGASKTRVILHHLLPNGKKAMMIGACWNWSSTILAESSLSFLGLGIQPPATSLGHLVYSGLSVMKTFPLRTLFPATLLLLTLLSINWMGDFFQEQAK